MSPISVTFRRTFGLQRNMISTAFSTAAFIMASTVTFAFGLDKAEGGALPLMTVIASSIALYLPAYVALLAMDSWGNDRATGRIDMMLSVAVRERDFVIGKWLGVVIFALTVCLGTSLAIVLALMFLAPSALMGVSVMSLLSSSMIIILQTALWGAVAVAVSAMFVSGPVAACVALVITIGLPRGLWLAMRMWDPSGSLWMGEMPFDANVVDFSMGMISFGPMMFYLLATVCALLIASKVVAGYRFVSHKNAAMRISVVLIALLGIILTGILTRLAYKTNFIIDCPVNGIHRFSPRMRQVLSESSGKVLITAFVPRHEAAFRSVSHTLRSIRQEADSIGALRVELRFVDPRWDLGAAEYLVGIGISENSIVFERNGRTAAISQTDIMDERVVVSALRRVLLPPKRRDIYWTVGHGEYSYDHYGPWGMSDVARDLAREGYENHHIDLGRGEPIPGDCALIIIAGAKDEFSRVEVGRIDSYLKQGGRVLVLLRQSVQGGIVSLLPSWGLRPVVRALDDGYSTFSGSDVVVSDFADHSISSALTGSRIVLEKPVVFESSASVGGGADRLDYIAIATVGKDAVVSAVERGVGAGDDLAFRPTRIVAVGDAGFALNASLTVRANANREFFLNSVAYLAGTDSASAGGQANDVLVSGMDRATRMKFGILVGGIMPAFVFVCLFSVAMYRRNRS